MFDGECLGHLSWVLRNMKSLSITEYKEADVLTMGLSLGGTIMPSQAGQYNLKGAFDFGGILVSDVKARK